MQVLLVEQERALATLLSRRLQAENHQVEVVSENALVKVTEQGFGLLILDLDLSGCNGEDLVRAARRAEDAAPIMVLSGSASAEERLKYFDLGADDCLTKPFALRELMVRLQRLIRRPRTAPEPVFRCADLELNALRRSVARSGKTIDLSAREYALMEYLMQHKGRCVPRGKLLQQVWEMPEKSGTNVVEVYVNYLRRKVDQGFGQPLIHTVRGQGYVLRESASAPASN